MKNTTSLIVTSLAAIAFASTGCGQKSETSPESGVAAVPGEAAESIASSAFPAGPLLDPNSASEELLSKVPGLSVEACEAILAGRPFATPTALHAAISEGLSEADQKSVYGAMFIPVDLNTGAEEDYKLIPSTMSPGKLAHEFEEYRPYESMDQFRREMAKYVSEDEVAHLERYVTIN